MEKVFAFPEGLEPSCCHAATSDRGCGWEDYTTLAIIPDGKRASGVRSVVIARRYFFVGHCRGDTASGARCGTMPLLPNTITFISSSLTFRQLPKLHASLCLTTFTVANLPNQSPCLPLTTKHLKKRGK